MPPTRKNGTSAPSRAPMRESVARPTSSFHNAFSASSVIAASELPPPSPASDGTRLRRSIAMSCGAVVFPVIVRCSSDAAFHDQIAPIGRDVGLVAGQGERTAPRGTVTLSNNASDWKTVRDRESRRDASDTRRSRLIFAKAGRLTDRWSPDGHGDHCVLQGRDRASIQSRRHRDRRRMVIFNHPGARSTGFDLELLDARSDVDGDPPKPWRRRTTRL